MADQSSADRAGHQREVWDTKPTLRTVYADFHRRLERACPAGPLLDIGGGSAHFKDYRPDVVSTDILPFTGIDVVADAHSMPFDADTFSGIVMLDVLHHLQRPVAFLREAARVLRVGGRLAMIEPGMSAVSRVFYDRLHHEPVDMRADPFAETVAQSGDDPWDSNQAIPSLMFGSAEGRRRLAAVAPDLRVVSATWLSLFAYPLSGGFKRWCLVPDALTRPLIALEDRLVPILGPALAFRLFVVLEKTSP